MIETLDSYGFTSREPAPGRGEDPDRWDAYPVEIGDLPDFGRDRVETAAPVGDSPFDSWSPVAERIDDIAARTGPHPPPESVDAYAWYLPFHYYGPDWGIYIREESVFEIAGRIKARLGGGRSTSLEVQQLTRAALSVLYLHEAFHHKLESFATRLEIARRHPVYLPYDKRVFHPLSGTDDLLEEAFACHEMVDRFAKEKSFHGNVRASIKQATLRLVRDWIPRMPPGYRIGLDVARQRPIGDLLSQVAESSVSPQQPASDWDIATHMIRGLFHKNSVAYVIVPIGGRPLIPWVGVERYLAVSTRDVERLITKTFGYHDTGRGKGSHRHFHCNGMPPITLPARREALSPGVQRQVASALGYRNIRDLAANC